MFGEMAVTIPATHPFICGVEEDVEDRKKTDSTT